MLLVMPQITRSENIFDWVFELLIIVLRSRTTKRTSRKNESANEKK